jgi:hypothetical protein
MLWKALKHFADQPDMFTALDIHQHIVAQAALQTVTNKFWGSCDENPVTPIFLRVNGHWSEPSIELRSFKYNNDGSGRPWNYPIFTETSFERLNTPTIVFAEDEMAKKLDAFGNPCDCSVCIDADLLEGNQEQSVIWGEWVDSNNYNSQLIDSAAAAGWSSYVRTSRTQAVQFKGFCQSNKVQNYQNQSGLGVDGEHSWGTCHLCRKAITEFQEPQGNGI